MGVEDRLRTLAGMRRWLQEHDDEYLLVSEVDDIDAARAADRLGVFFDIEGANAIGDQLSLIQLYYDLGVRWMLLAYNNNNLVAGGCQDKDTGLTDFGREVVAEMERVGMQVCLSHTGHRTVRDVFEVATRPVIFSHSNADAVRPHPRNISDELIRACAATGGVVGINGLGTFLGEVDNLVESYVRHVDHVMQLVGPEHVAISLDYVFDTEELEEYLATMKHTFPPELGYEDALQMVSPEDLEAVADRLIARGYSSSDLQAILGGNWMRLARTVWK
jgi:membrane dipeptidase